MVPQQTNIWKKTPRLHGNEMFLRIFERVVFLRVEFPTNLTKVLQILIFINKLLILMFFLQLLVQPSNLYSQQNGRNFLTNAKEVKDLISVNCIMAVSQSPIIPIYCDCNLYVDNVSIQNIFTRTRHQEVTKPSLYGQQRCKIRAIINHLNESFLAFF